MLTAPLPASAAAVESYLGGLLDSGPADRAERAPVPAAPAVAAPPPAGPVRAVPASDENAERRRRASDRIERWIGFSVAGQAFGVEVLRVLEVQRLSEITPVPGATPELMGAINLRGQIVPVLDLGQRLGFGVTAPTGAARIIIVDYAGQPAGLCVAGVSEVISASASSIEPTPPLGGRMADGWVHGVLRHRGEMVLLLDPLRLLADVERETAAAAES